MKSPLQHTVSMIAYLITALAALHIGLYGFFGFDLLYGTIMMRFGLGVLRRPVDIIIGLAGLYSLVMWFMCLLDKDCKSCS